MEEIIKEIKETVGGYKVKDLRFKPLDNIIVGLVKDEFFGKEIHDGYISCQWNSSGFPIRINKGRYELKLW